MIDINTTEFPQYLRRLGDLSGDVELTLFRYMRKYGHGNHVQAGKYSLEIHPTDHGVNGVYINGVHVLQANVSDAIDAIEALVNLINEE